MKLVVFIIVTLLSSIIQGQKNSILLVDLEDKKPIINAMVSLKDGSNYSISDKDGYVFLSKDFFEDSIIISSFGYKSVIRIGVKNGEVLKLEKEVYSLNSVEITDKKLIEETLGKKELGNKKGILSTAFVGNLRMKLAKFFDNDENKTGFIDEINLYINNKTGVENPFKLWIFSTKDCKPFVPITDYLVVTPHKKNGWQSISLKSLKIEIPNNGFWVVLEVLDDKNYFVDSGFYSVKDTTINNSKIWHELKKDGELKGYYRVRNTGIRTEEIDNYKCICAKQIYNFEEKKYRLWSNLFNKSHLSHCPRIKVTVRW